MYKSFLAVALASAPLFAAPLPENVQKLMEQPKYKNASWVILVKDSATGEIVHELNSKRMYIPASTTKLFSVTALLNAYGPDYRFKTSVYTSGKVQNGSLNAPIILAATGDFVFGGRSGEKDKIAFTSLDHVNANSVPGATLTKGDPLAGLNELAKQIANFGIKDINGDVLIDDRLFETTEKRGNKLSPISINENLFDFIIRPNQEIEWRPQAEGYTVVNEVKTSDEPTKITITSDASGLKMTVKGNISSTEKERLFVHPIANPQDFARRAFVDALRREGIAVHLKGNGELPATYDNMSPIATYISPPLSEYAKLILKVSHNIGADTIPLLLAAKNKQHTFAEGMLLIGRFTTETAKIPKEYFVFEDAAGGSLNRIVPEAVIQILEYNRTLPKEKFQAFFDALPIQGVDGSLAKFGLNSPGKGKVHAKTGTDVIYNAALGQLFLSAQMLGGYIDNSDGHTLIFLVGVNNAQMPTIEDVMPIFEEVTDVASSFFK